MATHKVHMGPQGDTLPADGWQTVEANDRGAAVVAALHLPANKGLQPRAVWVALGTGAHPSGAPQAVEKYALTWGAPGAQGVQHGNGL